MALDQSTVEVLRDLNRPVRRRQETPGLPPHMSWDEFIADVFRWYPGEHVGCIGPTGSGKTTLILALLPFRKYVTVIGTKPDDSTLADLVRTQHYLLMREWKDYSPSVYPRRVLWPHARALDSLAAQRNAILAGLTSMYLQSGGNSLSKRKSDNKWGGWCVVIDELWVLIHLLKLEKTVKTYLQQTRSLGMTLVVGTQRPAFIPLEVYDQSTHLFFWRDNDETNLKRISGISWLSARTVRETVAALPPHHALYINTRTATMCTTVAPQVESE
jgi:hypothetical protein